MKPSTHEFATAVKVLEWCVAELEENEPHAVNTIEELNTAAMNVGDMAE
jgi:hypothetical protein